MFERFYDMSEQAQVTYIGYATDTARYDFAIVYTKFFFGKPLVVCMQTNRSSVLDSDDLTNLEHLERAFRLSPAEAGELSEFLQMRMPLSPVQDQY